MIRVLFALLATLAALGAGGAEMVVVRPVDLRSDRAVDAVAPLSLNAGTRVEVLAVDAGWVQVRVDDRTGWLRATGLTGDAASVAALARPDGAVGDSRASGHALVVGIDRVATGTAATRRWPGVAYDVQAARLVAQRLGVPAARVEVVDGSSATVDGIGAAIARLAARVRPGDDVLVWFSGPGTQSADGGACIAAWVAAEGHALTPDALVGLLAPVLRAAGKTVVVSDASYQVAAAALGSARKVVATAGGCRSGQDALALVAAAVARGLDAQKLVVLQSAAGPDQGLDAPRSGGLLSQALLDCFLGDAAGADRPQSPSVDAVVACANRRPAGGPLVVVTGGHGGSP